jgi:FkbM family methyltransferase
MKKISAFYVSLNGNESKIVDHNVLNRNLKLIKGSFRAKPDKDDAWIQKLAESSEVMFDIGAHAGYTAILANTTGKIKELILVDANPVALSNAAKNLITNNMSANCRFYCAFVSDKEDELMKFYTVGSGAAGSMFESQASSAAALNKFSFVPTVTIDYLCKYYNVIPDLVKMDIEGAESLALKGAKEVFHKQSTKFIVEMHATAELTMAENANRILNWCNENFYCVWYLKEHKLLESADTIARRGICHLLLIPKKDSYPEELKSIKEYAEIK